VKTPPKPKKTGEKKGSATTAEDDEGGSGENNATEDGEVDPPVGWPDPPVGWPDGVQWIPGMIWNVDPADAINANGRSYSILSSVRRA
jgi:hypothetical protein